VLLPVPAHVSHILCCIRAVRQPEQHRLTLGSTVCSLVALVTPCTTSESLVVGHSVALQPFKQSPLFQGRSRCELGKLDARTYSARTNSARLRLGGICPPPLGVYVPYTPSCPKRR
jgi:hypothetical protein